MAKGPVFVNVNPQRVFLIRNDAEDAWDLIERGIHPKTGEDTTLLIARFYGGAPMKPGYLATWALDEVRVRGRA